MRWGSIAAAFGVAGLLSVACFSDPETGTNGGDDSATSSNSGGTLGTGAVMTPCVPGELQPCVCPNGVGNQRCNDEGNAYGPCECFGDDDPATTGTPSTTTSPPGTTDGGGTTADSVDTGGGVDTASGGTGDSGTPADTGAA